MGKETFVIDANIFLELLLEQERANECGALLNLLEEGKIHGAVTAFSLYGTEIILESRNSRHKIIRFLDLCAQSEAIEILYTNPNEEQEIFRIAEKIGLDIDDAHQYWAAKKLNARFVSFDKDFDQTDLKRYEPDEILKELV